MAVNNINKVNDENMSFPDAIKELEDRGADVVGVNCVRGPDTMIDIIKEVREKCKVRILKCYISENSVRNRMTESLTVAVA